MLTAHQIRQFIDDHHVEMTRVVYSLDEKTSFVEASCIATYEGRPACTIPERIDNLKQARDWLGY